MPLIEYHGLSEEPKREENDAEICHAISCEQVARSRGWAEATTMMHTVLQKDSELKTHAENPYEETEDKRH